MDEPNFQKQLHAIKERVSELSSKHSSSMRTHDPFLSQLHDLEAYLASMQERSTKYVRSMPQMRSSQEDKFPHVDVKDSIEARYHLRLPSGPLFWQLFDSLRTDVQSLDSRVATLESTVSDLEDKVDGMDPNRFTPPESASGCEFPFDHLSLNPLSNRPNDLVLELSSDTPLRPVQDLMQPPMFSWDRSTQADVKEPAQTGLRPLQYHRDEDDVRSNIASMGSVPSHSEHRSSDVANHVSKFDRYSDNLFQVPQSRSARTEQLPTYAVHGANDATNPELCGSEDSPCSYERDSGTKYTAVNNELQQKQHREYLDRIVEKVRRPTLWTPSGGGNRSLGDHKSEKHTAVANARLHDCMTSSEKPPGPPALHNIPKMKEGGPNEQQLWTRPVGGLAFRDREIARMDEQLRIAQERLRVSEEALAQNQTKLSEMQLERDEARVIVRLHEDRCREFEAQVEGRDIEIRDLRKRIERRHGDLANWEESWTQLHECYQHTSAKAEAYERKLQELQERKTSAINRLTQDHKREINGLRSICEQKDAVVYKQEQLISRGGKLLEQRDDEIESLRRQLRACEEDKEIAIRSARKTKQLLEERDTEVSRLKEMVPINDSLSRLNRFAQEVRQTTSSRTEVGNSERLTYSYPDERVHEAQNHHPRIYETQRTSEWTPAEAPTAYLWENANPENVHPDSSNGGLLRSTSAAKKRGRVSRRHNPYRYEVRDYWRPPTPLNAGSVETSDPATSTMRATAQGSELDDATLRPPLPAPPVTARRMLSEANLRTASSNNNAIPARRTLSKHQSLQELRGRRLQAYVESDAENEFGGEV